ncbi:hypothetical protein BG004_000603 [Podila humilis]|nr:hypothetical protein BG004_000603 [Podila humilis]
MTSPESNVDQELIGSTPSRNASSLNQRPSSQFTNGLFIASGTAFLTGIFGSLWYQGHRVSSKPAVGLSLQTLNDLKMAESLIKEGRLLGLKAFGIATTLCLSGAVLIVGTTRWALDVETIPEFSEKMRDLFPKQKTKFVDAVVGADRSMFGDSRAADNNNSSQVEAAAAAVACDDNTNSRGGAEKDLDHEDDFNILGRIERELRKLEQEEAETQKQQTANTDSSLQQTTTHHEN